MLTIVRDDLHPGYQIVQSVHAGMQFAAEYPQEFLEWHNDTNSIVSLSVEDESALERMVVKLKKYGAVFTEFREPDIDNQLTALCVYGTPAIRKKLSYLPLALKGRKQRAIDEHTGHKVHADEPKEIIFD